MNEHQIRERLEARRDDLERLRASAEPAMAEAAESPSDDLAHYDQHPADAATDTVERERNLSVKEMATEVIRDIDTALERLDQGEYGICEVCKEPIPAERLEVRPEARFCVQHAPRAQS